MDTPIMFERMPVKVIAYEGIHGVGKTLYLESLELSDKEVLLGEEFLDENSSCLLDRQGELSEFLWMANWLKQLIEAIETNPDATTFYTDRSPYSGYIYANSGNSKLYLVAENIISVLSDRNIADVTIVGLERDKEKIWKDVQDRIDPERVTLQEANRAHFDTVWDKYHQDATWITERIDISNFG